MTLEAFVREYIGEAVVGFMLMLLGYITFWQKSRTDRRSLDERAAERLNLAKVELERLLLATNKETVDRVRGEIRDISDRYIRVQAELEACRRSETTIRDEAARTAILLERRIADLTSEVMKVNREMLPSSGQEAVIARLDQAALAQAENAAAVAVKVAETAATVDAQLKEIHSAVNSPLVALMKRELAGKRRELELMRSAGSDPAAIARVENQIAEMAQTLDEHVAVTKEDA